MHAVPARRARRAHPAVRGRRRRRQRIGRARGGDRGGRRHRGARLEETRLFVPRGFRSRVQYDNRSLAETRCPRRRRRRGLRRSRPRSGRLQRRSGRLLFPFPRLSLRVVWHASRRGSRRILRHGRGRLVQRVIRCCRGCAASRTRDDLRREDVAAGSACVGPTGGRLGVRVRGRERSARAWRPGREVNSVVRRGRGGKRTRRSRGRTFVRLRRIFQGFERREVHGASGVMGLRSLEARVFYSGAAALKETAASCVSVASNASIVKQPSCWATLSLPALRNEREVRTGRHCGSAAYNYTSSRNFRVSRQPGKRLVFSALAASSVRKKRRRSSDTNRGRGGAPTCLDLTGSTDTSASMFGLLYGLYAEATRKVSATPCRRPRLANARAFIFQLARSMPSAPRPSPVVPVRVARQRCRGRLARTRASDDVSSATSADANARLREPRTRD